PRPGNLGLHPPLRRRPGGAFGRGARGCPEGRRGAARRTPDGGGGPGAAPARGRDPLRRSCARTPAGGGGVAGRPPPGRSGDQASPAAPGPSRRAAGLLLPLPPDHLPRLRAGSSPSQPRKSPAATGKKLSLRLRRDARAAPLGVADLLLLPAPGFRRGRATRARMGGLAMRRRAGGLWLVALALVLGACGDDPVEPLDPVVPQGGSGGDAGEGGSGGEGGAGGQGGQGGEGGEGGTGGDGGGEILPPIELGEHLRRWGPDQGIRRRVWSVSADRGGNVWAADLESLLLLRRGSETWEFF